MAKAVKLNLDQLTKEIDLRNQEKGVANYGGNNGARKDIFLSELKNSLERGVETTATTTIKLIENKAAIKNREVPIHNISNDQGNTQRPTNNVNYQRRGMVNEDTDREDQQFNDIKSRRSGLADAISSFDGGSQQQQNRPMNNSGGQSLNENAVNDAVIKCVNAYLSDNLAFVLEGAIKETILDLYAMDRIKQVITDSPEILEASIIKTFRKLQDKQKK